MRFGRCTGWPCGGIVVVLALVAAGRAAAETAPAGKDAHARRGFYAGVGTGWAFPDFGFDSDNLGLDGVLGPGLDPDYDGSVAVDAFLGYRVHRRVGLELGYTFYEGWDSRSGVESTEIDAHAFMLNTKAYGCTGRLQPYALLGVGALLVNSEIRDARFPKPFETDLGFALRAGGGVDLYLHPHWVLGLEVAYVAGFGGLVEYADHTTTGLRLQYRF